MKENKMGGAYIILAKGDKCIQNFSLKSDVGGRKILRRTSNK
jgi:hypothetical protein